jgi:hypothetical protein
LCRIWQTCLFHIWDPAGQVMMPWLGWKSALEAPCFVSYFAQMYLHVCSIPGNPLTKRRQAWLSRKSAGISTGSDSNLTLHVKYILICADWFKSCVKCKFLVDKKVHICLPLASILHIFFYSYLHRYHTWCY